MNLLIFIWRNLVFHRGAHAVVIAGMTIATAALTGALVVGDCVRGTLRTRALNRVANASWSVTAGDRFFRQELRSLDTSAVPVLVLRGAARHSSGKASANNVQVLGITSDYPGRPSAHAVSSPGPTKALVNIALAQRLGVRKGNEIVLRIGKPGVLARDAALAPRADATFGWRLEVGGILPAAEGGDLDLRGSGSEALNVFVPIESLAQQAGIHGKANVLLVNSGSDDDQEKSRLAASLREHWSLEDAGLMLSSADGGWQVRSPQVFIDDQTRQAVLKVRTNAVPALTYLANLIEHGTNATPYSMVAAAGPPYTPDDMGDDEIRVSSWLAEDLHLAIGSTLEVSFFIPESGAALRKATNAFRVRGILEPGGVHADKSLMPDFPGIEAAESTHEWDAGFPLEYKIRQKDEDYWRANRGTPKAFVTLRAGQRMWANRFGMMTTIRLPGVRTASEAQQFGHALLRELEPQLRRFAISPVKREALAAANQSQDFGQLFLAFSVFIVFAALLLASLVFQFGLESRLAEAGILGAIGFTPGRVRLVLLGETFLLSIVGAFLGLPLGVIYARVLLWALSSLWSGAVGGLVIGLHVRPSTLLVAAISAIAVSSLAAGLRLRGYGRRGLEDLLRGDLEVQTSAGSIRWGGIASLLLFLAAAAVVAWTAVSREASPPAFFGAGSLLLLAQWAPSDFHSPQTYRNSDGI